MRQQQNPMIIPNKKIVFMQQKLGKQKVSKSLKNDNIRKTSA
jgi:hypothetical protein